MIKYNNNTIYDWNFDTSNLIKVYRNNAIVFYKFSGESPTPEWKVCFAVVDDISQYTDREFEDVYDNATEKWYKLNNLNQYEEYGVYGSGRTSCEGLSRLPQGYTEVEYVQNNTEGAYLNLGVKLYGTIGNSYQITARYKSQYMPNWNTDYGLQTIINSEGVSSPYYGMTFRYAYNTHVLELAGGDKSDITWTNTDNGDGTSALTISSNSTAHADQVPLGLFASYQGNYTTPYRWSNATIYSMQITLNNELVRDLVPCIRDNDSMVGMYDLVNDVFYYPPNYQSYQLVAGDPATPTDCVTTYKGKLTIDDGYEYEWNGSSWVNLGEVTGSSRVPSGYVELTYAQTSKVASSSSNAFRVPIDLQETNNYIYEFTPLNWEESYYGHILGGNDGSTNFPKLGIFKLDNGWGDETRRFISAFWNYNLETRNSSPGGNYRVYDNVKSKFTMNLHNYTVGQGADIKVENEGYETVTHTSTTILRSGYSVTSGIYNIDVFSTSNGNSSFIALEQFHNLKVETNEGVAVYDYVPCERKSDNKVGLYDVVNNAFYSPSAFTLTAGDEASHTEYPKYYSEKSEPLDNLTFDTIAEAQTYAYNNCVYDGMKATIDGNRYYFDSSDENGWVKILEYYKVEDVTPSGASGWTISGSSTYNPDSSYYDDFDLETSWTSSLYKIAKVTIYGYDHFTYYLRSYNGWSSSYAYVMATNVDEVSTPPSTMSYSSPSAITNTYNWNKLPKSAVNLSNYRRVTYNNLDKTVEHTFYVYFYGRSYSNYVGNATILIPKEQTNENWEQVTFSASSNVALYGKNLFIDNNNSTSGGAQNWFYRWIVGLPSGNHTSYTNYSSYDYCPNVTSSTFTSVASEQRQVNFTYDGTTSKSLSFRLVDGSGDVLTPSNTVYYNMSLYNSCNVQSNSSNLTFPRSQYVKVGGGFAFFNSSNRHYIYGYQAPALSTRYNTDDYQDTFDIVYTKLNTEAVTITYTTYDPNDSETPAFKTDITYPYNGGTTSSTTLTSYDVPYTYPYEVSQTNNKFSADSQSYTASQAARTINFTLYPNNREFASVADMEAYGYAWEGMTAYVGDTRYKYENGEWVENQHSLPDVPFTVNYNAKNYDASTQTFAKTDGQLANTDVTISGGTLTAHDGYVTVPTGSRGVIHSYRNYFNRTDSAPNLTIISKQRTEGNNCHMFANRDTNYNWMYRPYHNKLTLHGTSEQGSIAVTTQPVIESVRIDSNRLATYNNYTNSTSSTSSFSYGSVNGAVALFAGYTSKPVEWFAGDFYWIYMSQNTLTDEQVQQVIDYNENL